MGPDGKVGNYKHRVPELHLAQLQSVMSSKLDIPARSASGGAGLWSRNYAYGIIRSACGRSASRRDSSFVGMTSGSRYNMLLTYSAIS